MPDSYRPRYWRAKSFGQAVIGNSVRDDCYFSKRRYSLVKRQRWCIAFSIIPLIKI